MPGYEKKSINFRPPHPARRTGKKNQDDNREKDIKIQQLPLSQPQTAVNGLPKVDFSFVYSTISDSASSISTPELRRSPKKKKTISTKRTTVEIEIV